MSNSPARAATNPPPSLPTTNKPKTKSSTTLKLIKHLNKKAKVKARTNANNNNVTHVTAAFINGKSAAQVSIVSFILSMVTELYPTMPNYNTYLALFFLYLTVSQKDTKLTSQRLFLVRCALIVALSILIDLDWLISAETPSSLLIDPSTIATHQEVKISETAVSTLAHLALFVNIGAKVFIFQKLTSSSKIGKKLQVSQRASERELNTFYLLLLLLLLH